MFAPSFAFPNKKRISYQTDLSDKELQKVEPYIPKPKKKRGRKSEHPLWELINAIFYVVRSGCAWRLLPHGFPPWKTVYHYFRLWRLTLHPMKRNIQTGSKTSPETS
jgi:putative transposase